MKLLTSTGNDEEGHNNTVNGEDDRSLTSNHRTTISGRREQVEKMNDDGGDLGRTAPKEMENDVFQQRAGSKRKGLFDDGDEGDETVSKST